MSASGFGNLPLTLLAAYKHRGCGGCGRTTLDPAVLEHALELRGRSADALRRLKGSNDGVLVWYRDMFAVVIQW